MESTANNGNSLLMMARAELAAKDKHIDKLEGDNRKLENINIDLENHINVIQEKLAKSEEENRALAATPEPKQNKLESKMISEFKTHLESLIERWKQSSKPTRDWTKANQLLSELSQMLGN